MIKLKLNPEEKNAKSDGKKEKKERKNKKGAVPRISLNLNENKDNKKVPRIKVKAGRQPGDGYDSEAPDREEDPMIQEAIALRMIPGEHLDYLREACDQGDLTGVNIKFKDSRNAVVSIHGQLFAAKLVDLPTVTEVHKSFDRKNIYKAADVCQMLIVTEPIEYEEEVFNVKEPPISSYPHGLTPPLHNVKKRRFRKRISNKIIETVEAKVDELFRLDEEAEETNYELLTPQQLNAANASAVNTGGAATTSSSTVEPSTPYDMLGSQATSPQVETPYEEDEDMEEDMLGELEKALGEEDEEEDDDEDDDDDDEKSDGGMDEEELEKTKHSQLLKEEISDLEALISAKEKEMETTVNKIMKGRQQDVINKLKGELEMKRLQAKEDAEEKPAAGGEDRPQPDYDEDEDDEDEDEDEDVESLF